MARSKANDHDEKRTAILRKAAVLFAELGYAGASISMIAQECKISKALTYHYYSDKEALLFDIISTHLQNLVEVVADATASAPEGREKLERLAVVLLEAYRDHDAEHQVQLSSLKLLPPKKQERLKDLERTLVEAFATAIAEARPETCRAPRLLKPLTMSLFGMLNWHYLWFREGGSMARADYARLACRLVLEGSSSLLADADPTEGRLPTTAGDNPATVIPGRRSLTRNRCSS